MEMRRCTRERTKQADDFVNSQPESDLNCSVTHSVGVCVSVRERENERIRRLACKV